MVTALRLSPTFRELFRKGRSWRYFLITKYCNFGASEELNLVASNEEDPTVEANGKVCTGYSSWFKPHSCSASQGGDLSCLHPCSFVIGVHSKDEKHEQPFSFGVPSWRYGLLGMHFWLLLHCSAALSYILPTTDLDRLLLYLERTIRAQVQDEETVLNSGNSRMQMMYLARTVQ